MVSELQIVDALVTLRTLDGVFVPSKKLSVDFSVFGIVEVFFVPLCVISKPMEPSIPAWILSSIAKFLIDESFDRVWEVVVVVSKSFGLNSQGSIRKSFDLNNKKVKTSPSIQSMMLVVAI